MNTPTFRSLRLRGIGLFALLLAAGLMLSACSHGPKKLPFRLTNVTGHLPNLNFRLTDDHGKVVTGKDFRGKVVMMYFGYTHCPDVCPLTMTRMHVVMQQLGKEAKDVRFLFITVDPERDTVKVLHQYVTAFDKHDIGLRGTPAQTRAMAKLYRAAYTRGKTLKNGGYDVNHSAAIYVFDRHGRARVLATPTTRNVDLEHDLRLLIASGN